MSAIASTADDAAVRTRKRPRAARACETCRAKKYRCDELYPCTQCKKQNSECIYQGAENVNKRLRSSSYVAQLERKVEELTSNANLNSADGVLNAPLSPEVARNSSRHLKSDRLYSEVPQHEMIAAPPVPFDTSSWANQPQHEENDERNSDTVSIAEAGGEVRDVNDHTKSIEYHGNTSSMAFLSVLQSQNEVNPQSSTVSQKAGTQKPSLISALHNVAFSPDSNMPSAAEAVNRQGKGYYFRQSRIFVDGYFENLHFIHPILEREAFLARCEDLWFGRSERQPRSFVALYYSLLSLGALIRVWDEDLLDGMNRFQWSRKLFNHAQLTLGELRSMNDLETIQCWMFMAKVCQNELSPHQAYMFLGLAVRASLSAGFHREPRSNNTRILSGTSDSVSKTWWGLYSLEIEMSFSLGRPDSLGLDDYHNRRVPATDDSETAILPVMISFARITRKVSVGIYLSKSSMRNKISMANEIEAEMNAWLDLLPERIRPGLIREQNGLRILKDPKWARRQRLVLQLRYCNVMMVLYRPFLIYASRSPRRLPVVLEATLAKCVDAARKTIELMHETFYHHVFFRSWWYNTTYILYAASIILCYATQAALAGDKPDLFRLVDMTVEVLEAMDECEVAVKAGKMIKQTLAQAREHAAASHFPPVQMPSSWQDHLGNATDLSMNAILDSQMPSLHMDAMFDFDEANLAMDETQFLFWTDIDGALGIPGV